MKVASLVTTTTLRHLIADLPETVDEHGHPMRFGYVRAKGDGREWEIDTLKVTAPDRETTLLVATLILTSRNKEKRYASLDALERDCTRMLGESSSLLIERRRVSELKEWDESGWTTGE